MNNIILSGGNYLLLRSMIYINCNMHTFVATMGTYYIHCIVHTEYLFHDYIYVTFAALSTSVFRWLFKQVSPATSISSTCESSLYW